MVLIAWSYVDGDNVEFVGGLSVSDEKLREIERNTRSQSDCDRWFEENYNFKFWDNS
jgi:hypothetical protein